MNTTVLKTKRQRYHAPKVFYLNYIKRNLIGQDRNHYIFEFNVVGTISWTPE